MPGRTGSLLLSVANYLFSFVIVTGLLAAMFKILPDAKIRWSDVWVDAIATAALFMIGKLAIATYVANQSMEATYGAASSLVVVLMWVYYSSFIFLFGAEFTQAWAKHRGPGIIPDEGALRVVRKVERVPVHT